MKKTVSLSLIALAIYAIPTYGVKNPFTGFLSKKTRRKGYTEIKKSEAEKRAEDLAWAKAAEAEMDAMGFCVDYSGKEEAPKKSTKK